jgi:hypothetical protein
MNVVTFTLLYQLCCIFVFTCLYITIGSKNFTKQKNENPELTTFDYLFYSLTVQSTVGLPDITATSQISKVCVTIHQFFVILTPVVVINFLMKK